MSIIYDEIKQGEKGSREKFAKVDRAIRSAGCDCAILACTEQGEYIQTHTIDLRKSMPSPLPGGGTSAFNPAEGG